MRRSSKDSKARVNKFVCDRSGRYIKHKELHCGLVHRSLIVIASVLKNSVHWFVLFGAQRCNVQNGPAFFVASAWWCVSFRFGQMWTHIILHAVTN